MRQSRLRNDQLALLAASYRHNASDEKHSSWPENSEEYRSKQEEIAEVYEELLDHRLKLGDA